MLNAYIPKWYFLEVASPKLSVLSWLDYLALKASVSHISTTLVVHTQNFLACSSISECRGLMMTSTAMLEYATDTMNIATLLPAVVATCTKTSFPWRTHSTDSSCTGQELWYPNTIVTVLGCLMVHKKPESLWVEFHNCANSLVYIGEHNSHRHKCSIVLFWSSKTTHVHSHFPFRALAP